MLKLDLDKCLYPDGRPIPQDRCEAFKLQMTQRAEVAERNRAAAAQFAQQREARAEADRARQAAEDERRRQVAETAAAEQARRKAENEAAIARTSAWLDREERAEAARERKAASHQAAMKSACGDDYRAPRIGMHIRRAELCAGPLTLTGQINRRDGVLSTYSGPGLYVHVIDDTVVAWGRR
ncbi:MAG: hypothetical protein IIZ92_28695 [Aquincola sp.]|nr:hypothetical protein [Aquincola sp.]